MKANDGEPIATPEELGPATFYVREPGVFAAMIVVSLALAAIGSLMAYGAMSSHGAEGTSYSALSGVLLLAALGLPTWLILRSRRNGRIVIDPIRGEIRLSADHAVPFSQVRQVEVMEHEYTYVGAELEGGSYSSDITGWAVDIGGGVSLFGQSGLSSKRVAAIAHALKIRVDAYRARTGEGAEPLPRPTKKFLQRLAASLRDGGETFQADWLSLDGPMAELIREYSVVPDERTMGRDGEFAQALGEAGFDLGAAPSSARPSGEDP